jgi:hypothetical protein
MKDYYAKGEDKKLEELIARAKQQGRPIRAILREARECGEWPLS